MITHIKLKNFKCFSDEPFQIAPLTLFTGINGMGKSSVIQSLLLLKQSFANNYLQSQGKVILENKSFVDLENCEELCNKKAYPKTVEITLENDREDVYNWIIDASIPDKKDPSVVFNGSDNYKSEALFSDNFIYLTAERLGPRKSYGKTYTDRNYNTILGIQGELTPTFIQMVNSENKEIGIENLIHPSIKNIKSNEVENPKLLYRNLNAWLSDILGRTVITRVSDIDKDNVKLSFSIKGHQGGEYSSLQVGFGYSFSLPVILAPLIAKPGDLLVIENPEAHLHPSAQSKIGILLALAAQNGVQVIIETHSDHILNGIRLAVKGTNDYGKVSANLVKVHFFFNEEDVSSRRILSVEPNGKLSGWPSGFFDEWEKNIRNLIS